MSLCYLALDRSDLQFPPKEMARRTQAPTVWTLGAAQNSRQKLDRTLTRDQDTEQDCEMGPNLHVDRDVKVVEYEADPRHAELIIHQLGLSCLFITGYAYAE